MAPRRVDESTDTIDSEATTPQKATRKEPESEEEESEEEESEEEESEEEDADEDAARAKKRAERRAAARQSADTTKTDQTEEEEEESEEEEEEEEESEEESEDEEETTTKARAKPSTEESEEEEEEGSEEEEEESEEESDDDDDRDPALRPAAGGDSPRQHAKAGAKAGAAASSVRASKFDPLKQSLGGQANKESYLRALGPLAAAAQPSRLQRLLKNGTRTLSEALRPRLAPHGLSFSNMEVDGDQQLLPMDAPTCVLTLMEAKAVPDSGLEGRKMTLQRARLCLYDGVTFVGNAQAVDATRDAVKPWNWSFKAGAVDTGYKNSTFYVRHQPSTAKSFTQGKLMVYLEVTVAVEPDQAALEEVTKMHRRKAAQVDEVATGWCVFPLMDTEKLTEQTMQVKLVGGTLGQPQRVAGPQAQLDFTSNKLMNRFTNKKPREPMVIVKMFRVPTKEVEVTKYLPPVCLIQPSLAAMAATYRQITAARLHTPTGEVHHTHLFSPVLSALPHIFDDEDIYRAFVTLWLQQPKTTAFERKDTLLRFEALHSCVLRMWPMTMLENLPPGSLSSDQEHTAKRIGVIKDYLKQHPVQPLSKAPAWHNEPFDSSELAYRFVDHIL